MTKIYITFCVSLLLGMWVQAGLTEKHASAERVEQYRAVKAAEAQTEEAKCQKLKKLFDISCLTPAQKQAYKEARLRELGLADLINK
jgi:uroporphyrinogen-III synthase